MIVVELGNGKVVSIFCPDLVTSDTSTSCTVRLYKDIISAPKCSALTGSTAGCHKSLA
jgi:hypothetical protein